MKALGVLNHIKKKWDELTEGTFGVFIYIALGILCGLIFFKSLCVLLNTNTPITWVSSTSMQHDNVELTHYKWLEEQLNYTREFINSWPYKKGFLKGDMPIIRGMEKYSIGDVIVFDVQGQDTPIIHRIIKINEDGSYQTKGDNNLNQLPYEKNISKDQIHGKVIFIIPKLGYLRMFIYKIFGV